MRKPISRFSDVQLHIVVHRCAMPRNDESYGGGTFVIGFFCANAATVEVPIGPFSS